MEQNQINKKIEKLIKKYGEEITKEDILLVEESIGWSTLENSYNTRSTSKDLIKLKEASFQILKIISLTYPSVLKKAMLQPVNFKYENNEYKMGDDTYFLLDKLTKEEEFELFKIIVKKDGRKYDNDPESYLKKITDIFSNEQISELERIATFAESYPYFRRKPEVLSKEDQNYLLNNKNYLYNLKFIPYEIIDEEVYKKMLSKEIKKYSNLIKNGTDAETKKEYFDDLIKSHYDSTYTNGEHKLDTTVLLKDLIDEMMNENLKNKDLINSFLETGYNLLQGNHFKYKSHKKIMDNLYDKLNNSEQTNKNKEDKLNKYFEEQKKINPNLTREKFNFIVFNNGVTEKEKNLLRSDTYRLSKGEYNTHNEIVIFLLKNGIRLDENFINHLKKSIFIPNINKGEFHQEILGFARREGVFIENNLIKNNNLQIKETIFGNEYKIEFKDELEEKLKLEITTNDKFDVSKLNNLLLNKNKLFNVIINEFNNLYEQSLIHNISVLDSSIPTLTKVNRKSFLDFPIEPRTNYKLETDVEKIKKMNSYVASGTKDLIEEKDLDQNIKQYYEKIKENFFMFHKEIIYKGEKLERKENVTTFKKQTILEFKYYDSKNNEYKMLKDKLYIKKGENFEEVKDFNIENKIKQSSTFNSDAQGMNN